jgi:hypothetical protein
VFELGDPTAGEVLDAVTTDIAAHFGLSPGLAASVADDVTALWDEAG